MGAIGYERLWINTQRRVGAGIPWKTYPELTEKSQIRPQLCFKHEQQKTDEYKEAEQAKAAQEKTKKETN